MQAVDKCDFPLSTPTYNSHCHLTQDTLQIPRLCLWKKRHINESTVANGDDIQSCIFENHLNPLLCKINSDMHIRPVSLKCKHHGFIQLSALNSLLKGNMTHGIWKEKFYRRQDQYSYNLSVPRHSMQKKISVLIFLAQMHKRTA